MRTEKFQELFSFAKKSNLKAGEGQDEGLYPFYTSSSILKKRLDKAQYHEESLVIGNGGAANIHYVNEPFSVSSHCIVVNKKAPNLNLKFIYYYLIGNVHVLERGFKGAGLQNISQKYIQDLDIPIFDLETQNKIVAILDKASALVQKRQQTIDLMDELLRAQFLEMFGDPVINSKGWSKRELKDIGEIITGNTPPRGKQEYYDSNFIEWIKTDNILADQIYLSNSSEHLSELGLVKGRSVKSQSLLVACIAGSLSSIGRAAINDRDVAFNQQINAIVPNEDTSVYFLYFLFKYSSQYIQDFASKGMKKIITKGVFSSIPIISPSDELQFEFENLVKSQISFKSKLLDTKQELSHLFNSLIQQAFSGKLNLDVSVELDALLEEIDLQKPENDLFSIITNEEYLLSLVNRLNNQEFENQDLYDKAKHVAFQLLKEEERLAQEYDEQSKSLKLVVK